jgi:LysM repeat protein
MEEQPEGDDHDQVRDLRRRLWAERVVFVLIVGGVLAFHFRGVGEKKACLIAVDGRPAVVVASRRIAERVLDGIKASSGLPGQVGFTHKVTFHSVSAAGKKLLSDADAMGVLAAKLQPVVQASAILVNGEVVVGLPSREEAIRTISLLLERFSPPGPDVSRAFKEKVSVETQQVPADRFISTAQEAVERMVRAAGPKGKHEVRPGETGWKIALEHQVPLSRLQAANPGVDLDRIRAGDQLEIPGETSPLTVIARKEVQEDLGGGRTGTVRITYENGVEVSRDVIKRQPPAGRVAGRRRRLESREEQGL